MQNSKLQVHDVRVLRGATYGSGHHSVRAKVLFPYTINKETKQENFDNQLEEMQYPKYNLDSLMHDSIKELYQRRLDEKLKERSEESFSNIYKNIINSLHEAAKEALGILGKMKSNKIWWNREIEEMVQEKKKRFLKWLCTKTI